MRFFSSDNLAFRLCEQLFDLTLLSLLWVLLCIPVVTIGPATTALYYAVVKCVRHNELGTLGNFFASFCANFKIGAATGLIAVASGLLLLLPSHLLTALAQTGSSAGFLFYFAHRVFSVFFLGLICWLFPILSRFSVGMGELFKSAFRTGLKHLPTTIVASFIFIGAIELTLIYMIPILITPGLAALLISFFYERVFKTYTPHTAGQPSDSEKDISPWYLQ